MICEDECMTLQESLVGLGVPDFLYNKWSTKCLMGLENITSHDVTTSCFTKALLNIMTLLLNEPITTSIMFFYKVNRKIANNLFLFLPIRIVFLWAIDFIGTISTVIGEITYLIHRNTRVRWTAKKQITCTYRCRFWESATNKTDIIKCNIAMRG